MRKNGVGRNRTTTFAKHILNLNIDLIKNSKKQNSLVERRHFGKEKKVVRNEYTNDNNNNMETDDKNTPELSKYLKILYGLVDREIKRIDRRRKIEIY